MIKTEVICLCHFMEIPKLISCAVCHFAHEHNILQFAVWQIRMCVLSDVYETTSKRLRQTNTSGLRFIFCCNIYCFSSHHLNAHLIQFKPNHIYDHLHASIYSLAISCSTTNANIHFIRSACTHNSNQYFVCRMMCVWFR